MTNNRKKKKNNNSNGGTTYMNNIERNKYIVLPNSTTLNVFKASLNFNLNNDYIFIHSNDLNI